MTLGGRLASLGAACAIAAFFAPGLARAAGGETLIQDVTLISPERAAPLRHADVLIRDGRIARIGTRLAAGPQVRRIDGRGRYLIPGLIDSHVHLGAPGPLDDDALDKHPELLADYRAQLPRSYLAFGFTSLIDLDLAPKTRGWFETAPAHPNFHSCGHGVRVAGGYQAQRPPKDAAAAEAANLVFQPGQADKWFSGVKPADFTPERAVQRVVDAGGVCVKTYVEPGFGGAYHWPVPTAETLAALRAETTRRHLTFIVHANGVESWPAVIGAHADVIAHGLWQWPGDLMSVTPPPEARRLVAAAARAGIRVQPTLQAVYGDESIFDPALLDDPRLAEALPRSVMTYLHGPEGQAARRAMTDEYREAFAKLGATATNPKAAMAVPPARATATLKLMLADKVELLFGTDTPANEGIGNPPGLNGRLELQRWAEAGVPLAQILRAATLDNAAAFRLAGDVGSIQAGKRADLLLLGADPLKTITAYDRIETVFLNGQPLSRASLLPAP